MAEFPLLQRILFEALFELLQYRRMFGCELVSLDRSGELVGEFRIHKVDVEMSPEHVLNVRVHGFGEVRTSIVPGIETNDFEREIAEFVHEPWRHRSGLDSYAGVISRSPADQNSDLLAPP